MAPTAGAHARLEGVSPPNGAVEKRAPQVVVFHFEEAVEARLGSVRVVDGRGRRVDDGRVFHPGGRGVDVAVRLLPDAARGTWRATYEVISDDGHPVSGGSDFGVGQTPAAMSARSMRHMSAPHTGPATDAAFGIARAATYLATALVVGLLAFLWLVWRPALDATAGGTGPWARASAAFGMRVRRILYVSVELGVIAALAGIVLEGATATGTSFWSAFNDHVFRDVTGTRFGGLWALRLVDFLTLGAVLILAGREAVVPELRRAALGAEGLALPKAGPRLVLTVAMPVAALVVIPALAGHATDARPALMIPVDSLHVLAMSVWLGGLAAVLAAVPAATRRLDATDANRLLASVVLRFSAIALAAVIVLVGTGVVQALEHVGSWGALTATGYGRAVLVKIGLTLALVCLGALNRRRAVPSIERVARGEGVGEAPARLLRRAVAAEVVLVVAVLGVTSALVAYAPPGG
ncbi:MAG: copper resistance CopC/CopD family protein [Gaiellaceae bacterium]